MSIVEEYKIGNTTIKIADDACKKTPEEIDAILSRITSIAWSCVKAAREAGKDI